MTHHIQIQFVNKNCLQIFIEVESILNAMGYHIKSPHSEQCHFWEDGQHSDISYDLVVQTIANQKNCSTQFWMYSDSEEFGFSRDIFVTWSFAEKCMVSFALDGHTSDSKKEIISCIVERYFSKPIFYDSEITLYHD
jgi:hypothetical protein